MTSLLTSFQAPPTRSSWADHTRILSGRLSLGRPPPRRAPVGDRLSGVPPDVHSTFPGARDEFALMPAYDSERTSCTLVEKPLFRRQGVGQIEVIPGEPADVLAARTTELFRIANAELPPIVGAVVSAPTDLVPVPGCARMYRSWSEPIQWANGTRRLLPSPLGYNDSCMPNDY